MTTCQHQALSHAPGTFGAVTKPHGGSADGLNARQRRRHRIGKRPGYPKYEPLLRQVPTFPVPDQVGRGVIQRFTDLLHRIRLFGLYTWKTACLPDDAR